MANDDFIKYDVAAGILKERINASYQEIAFWVFLGPEDGGLTAYAKADNLMHPLGCEIASTVARDYLPILRRRCWFRRMDIEQFTPKKRYWTVADLVEHWRVRQAPLDFIQDCATGDPLGLLPPTLELVHPTFGIWFPGDYRGDNQPPIEEYLVAVSEVEAIETAEAASIEASTTPLEGWDKIVIFIEANQLAPWRNNTTLGSKITRLKRMNKATEGRFIDPGSSGVPVKTDGHRVKRMLSECQRQSEG